MEVGRGASRIRPGNAAQGKRPIMCLNGRGVAPGKALPGELVDAGVGILKCSQMSATTRGLVLDKLPC